MSTVRTRAVENIEAVFVFLVLGAGFIAMFVGFNFFWIIWVLGFAVLLPLLAILTGEDEDESTTERTADETSLPAERSDANGGSMSDTLATLRDRYARGELTDEQFERKLDRLFETEYPESAAEWRTRERERVEEHS